MQPVLIDTNLLIYLFDFHSPQKQAQAHKVLDRLEQAKSGRMSVQNLSEFVHVSTHKLDPPLTPVQAFDQVNLFMRTWPIFDLTPFIVLEAVRGVRDHGLAYYDAQIWASARLHQIQVIFSEDFNSGQMLEGVRFINPFAVGFQLEDWG
jgi:predicted nucleic acid-binding protein